MKMSIIKLRIILWHILVIAVLFFVYMAIVPSGHISYVYDLEKDSSFISKLSPRDRVEFPLGGAQKIIGDPVYFSLETPRKFNEAVLSIKYKNNNPLDNPIIEAGVLVDKTVWRYKLEPLDNHFLNYIYDEWAVFEGGGVSLFVNPNNASSTYDSVDSFLANPPATREIAIYDYDLDIDYVLENYASSSGIKVFETDLRGPYQILAYIDNEDLYFDFSFIDVNKNKDDDEININLYFEDQLIDSGHLDDDGVKDDSGENSGLRNLRFDLVNMPKGVYKIELRVGDDIVTKSIETKQNKLSFLNKIWISDENISDFSVFTDSNIIYAQTSNPSSVQEIQFATSTFILGETFRQFSQELEASTTELIFEKGDIILAGNGVFSFNFDSLLNPNIKKIDSSFDLRNTEINYILADYEKPEKSGDYFTKEIKIDLAGAYRENSKYSFLISIPGLRVDDKINDSIEIDEIKVDLRGTDLLGKIKTIFK
ncbi:MAG: hypothetical protein PF572_03515 [Patescibacteria group bacterium]|jgi:hypothetical protein|nr:hypothetical protein [Patescibacteria group bacterium]